MCSSPHHLLPAAVWKCHLATFLQKKRKLLLYFHVRFQQCLLVSATALSARCSPSSRLSFSTCTNPRLVGPAFSKTVENLLLFPSLLHFSAAVVGGGRKLRPEQTRTRGTAGIFRASYCFPSFRLKLIMKTTIFKLIRLRITMKLRGKVVLCRDLNPSI